ncbi:MAG: YggS family pyridoxal phosphate-dependent enzyme [Chromatiales bacterium]
MHKRIELAATSCERDPATVALLAVSKTKPAEAIRAAYVAGQSRFGENYVQEALEKMEQLQDLDIEWHYIGGIQSNKTRLIAHAFAWVHGVASLKHARRLSEQRPSDMPLLNLCLQINISGESSKQGVTPEEARGLAREIARLPNIRLRGLMALPEPTDDTQRQHLAFSGVRALFDELRRDGHDLDTLSMGMSGDLEAAIQEGSTMVRIGTAIFGART